MKYGGDGDFNGELEFGVWLRLILVDFGAWGGEKTISERMSSTVAL